MIIQDLWNLIIAHFMFIIMVYIMIYSSLLNFFLQKKSFKVIIRWLLKGFINKIKILNSCFIVLNDHFLYHLNLISTGTHYIKYHIPFILIKKFT